MFYKNKIKIIPDNIEKLLTPISLAYWIMDDGGITTYKQTVLHTRAFCKKEVLFIVEILNKNFKLEARIEEKKKDQWIIYIPVKQKIKLKDIVGPIYMKVCYIKYNNMFYNLNNLTLFIIK